MQIEMILSVILVLAMLLVVYFDTSRYIIPNWLNLALLALYPVWVLLAPEPLDWPWALATFAIFLVVGFGLFAVNLLGAGDVKLLAVLGLYLGWSEHSFHFILYMTLLGGLLTIFLLFMRRILKKREHKATLFTPGAPVPYGIAIAAAFLFMLAYGHVPGVSALI